MDQQDAEALIRDAVSPDGKKPGGLWADLGAGTGTFTEALATIVGEDGTVHAVEPDQRARTQLTKLAAESRRDRRGSIIVSAGDFTKPLELGKLSGVLLANSLHFVTNAQQEHVLKRIAGDLLPGGRIILVEYDREQGNQWVPHPVSKRKFVALCEAAGLNAPTFMLDLPSAFGGSMYSAWTSAR